MESMLTSTELEMLEQVLKEYLTELRTEIVDTDDFDYRQRLKEKEELLRGIVVKIGKRKIAHLN